MILCTINVLAQCMSIATFVCDVRLSPEVLMKRPVKDEGGKWRLDMILKRRAVSSELVDRLAAAPPLLNRYQLL